MFQITKPLKMYSQEFLLSVKLLESDNSFVQSEESNVLKDTIKVGSKLHCSSGRLAEQTKIHAY